MNAATVEFLKQRFADYFRTQEILVPSSSAMREWAFVPFDSGGYLRMRRHLGFGTPDEVGQYIRTMTPAHVYYSTAYYLDPGAPTMAEKGWTGADLIFDLDADHLMRGPYPVMLARVKEETEKLITMLTEELGFSPGDLKVVFSGGRGYHVHIQNQAVRGWRSGERRELIDYVCGTGLDPAALLAKRGAQARGWHSRYRGALIEYLTWLQSLPPEEVRSTLLSLSGVGETTADRFLAQVTTYIEDLQTDPPGVNPADLVFGRVINAAMAEKEGELISRIRSRAALADEPVTTDIHRLIRMPGSLHGGSGLKVTQIRPGDLHAYDPLVDAVAFGEREVKIEVSKAVTVALMGSSYPLAAGLQSVPEAVAVFVCCRGMGEIGGSSGHATR